MMARLQRIPLYLLLAALSACASIDFDYPREASYAFDEAPETALAAQLYPIVHGQPEGQSGFFPLNDGIDALAMRLMLAERAERSIDLQYYLIKNDISGRALVASLLAAADRGVRVRLLLDDVFTSGYDDALAGLDSHPNIEIRIYNPFHRGFAGRARSGLTGFRRINRRMHNKSFTVDNTVTVVGGRNIADEYFGAREDSKFSDLDVVGIGPVVGDVSGMFDTYWNHETALPIPAFARMPDDPTAELERTRRDLEDWRDDVLESPYAEAVRQTALRFVDASGEALHWAPYELVYDSPDKGVVKRADTAGSILTPLAESLRSAEKKLVIVSPYFVPRKSGVESLARFRERGIDVTIITNSLAANNQFTVHGGYAPSRKPLLRKGVRIYEVRPDADVSGSELVAASGATATLHTKAFIVDDREIFIGSFNFDPRSAYLNTESGLIIRSPVMARNFDAAIEAALPQQAYELFLNEDGRLRWRDTRGEAHAVLDKEPQTTWMQRFIAGLVGLLPIRSQL
jgi:putative cardiolipin synthase